MNNRPTSNEINAGQYRDRCVPVHRKSIDPNIIVLCHSEYSAESTWWRSLITLHYTALRWDDSKISHRLGTTTIKASPIFTRAGSARGAECHRLITITWPTYVHGNKHANSAKRHYWCRCRSNSRTNDIRRSARLHQLAPERSWCPSCGQWSVVSQSASTSTACLYPGTITRTTLMYETGSTRCASVRRSKNWIMHASLWTPESTCSAFYRGRRHL